MPGNVCFVQNFFQFVQETWDLKDHSRVEERACSAQVEEIDEEHAGSVGPIARLSDW